jgi:hypothetical protein
MPFSDTDHVQHMKQRLQNRLQEIERERLEVQEMLRVINEMPRVLGKSSTLPAPAPANQPVKSVGRTLQNRNVTALVREFIDGYERDKAIDIPTLVKNYLMEQHGVKGKYRSLYSAVCVILKKETQKPDAQLAHESGVGFFKPKKSVELKPSDSVLVHAS